MLKPKVFKVCVLTIVFLFAATMVCATYIAHHRKSGSTGMNMTMIYKTRQNAHQR